VREEVAERVAALSARGRSVGLATVMVGDDPASQIYVRNKHRAADRAGMLSFDHNLPADSTQDEVEGLIRSLNADPSVDGMIVQLPLPGGLDGNRAVQTIDPAKDADGLHPYNLGMLVLERHGPRPATPSGIIRLLGHFDVEIEGKLALIIGRSFLVGRPLALMLGAKGINATTIQAHSRTPDLSGLARMADILVVAAGRPGLVTADDVRWVMSISPRSARSPARSLRCRVGWAR
jgi:methylenetetrahydrofolate dehydrogenase (NADP+)/methenyltetrahydrofolate cyclohydrolase